MNKPSPRLVWVSPLKCVEVTSHLSIDRNRLVKVKLNVFDLENPRIFVRVPYLRVEMLLRNRTYFGVSYNAFTRRIVAYAVSYL